MTPQSEGHMASHIRRRKFLATLLGGAAAAWPLAARAQQAAMPVRPLIGVLSPLSAASASRNVTALRSALRDLGYVEGRNMTLALRYGAPFRYPTGEGRVMTRRGLPRRQQHRKLP